MFLGGFKLTIPIFIIEIGGWHMLRFSLKSSKNCDRNFLWRRQQFDSIWRNIRFVHVRMRPSLVQNIYQYQCVWCVDVEPNFQNDTPCSGTELQPSLWGLVPAQFLFKLQCIYYANSSPNMCTLYMQHAYQFNTLCHQYLTYI
jgi:hypothetical protein